MPTTITRLFATETQAAEAVEKLKAAGYSKRQIKTVSLAAGRSAKPETVTELAAQLRQLGVYATAAKKYAGKMSEGSTVVVLVAAFGRAAETRNVLDQLESVDAGVKFEENYSHTDRDTLSIIRTSGRRSIVRVRAKPKGSKARRKPTPFLGLPTIIRPKKLQRSPSHAPVTKGLFPMLLKRKR